MTVNTTLKLVCLSLVALVLAACSRVAETPELGVSTSGAPTEPVPTAVRPTASPAAVDETEAPEPTAAPTEPPPPTITPTFALPEGVISLPTAARATFPPPPNTPIPIFPEGALEATRAVLPAATPDVAVYNAVYQRYQGGAMLYIAETRQIWVMVEGQGRRGGPYYRFDDLFLDGDPERVEDLDVPPGLLQPHRGFGRIWREQPGLRSQLGWAADYEIPFIMRAARVTTGAFDATGSFNSSASIWMMTLHDTSIAYFNEATNTWGVAAAQ